MNVEILTKTPVSGQYLEKSFGTNFNSTLWVKFTTNDYQEWVANFSRSSNNLDKILWDEENDKCIVVAGGMPYAINIETKEKIITFDDYPLIESAIKTNNPNLFLLANYYEIQAITQDLEIKICKPHYTMVDGIYFLEQKDNVVLGHFYCGELNQNDNIGFELNLKTFLFNIDKTIKYKSDYMNKEDELIKFERKIEVGFLDRIKNIFR